jgi:hypothetical protein
LFRVSLGVRAAQKSLLEKGKSRAVAASGNQHAPEIATLFAPPIGTRKIPESIFTPQLKHCLLMGLD